MTFDVAAFRSAFTQFFDPGVYPDTAINGWVSVAANSAMGNWFANASLTEQQLLVAHIGVKFTDAANGDSSSGAVTSASEGSVSASFTPPPVKTALEYWLSSTSYGVQLWALLKIAGAAGQVIGGLPERSAFRKVGGVWV